jgi:flagellar biosynthetic protein FliS
MNAIASYRRNRLENAPNEDILVMLLNEAVRRELEAGICMENKDRAGWIGHIHVARAIFMELRMALDADTPPEISNPLRNTYSWCIHHLTDVAHSGDVTKLAEIQRVTAMVEDTWTRAVQISRGETPEEPSEGTPEESPV